MNPGTAAPPAATLLDVEATYGFGRPIARILRDFRLVQKLGEGAMGLVFKAHWVDTDVDVALKILSPRLAADREFVQRFRREAQMSIRLNHPNIVRGYTVGEQEGIHYFAMEFVEGENLESWMQRAGHLSVGDAVRIAIDVARALEHAHSRHPEPIFHRDVKPANIMITPQGEVKLTDLGLAKAAEDASGLTEIGEAAGTPAYMPPEQARNAKLADHRADIYALGATLYVLLTGRKPFTGKTLAEVVEQKERAEYEPAHQLNAEVPEKLDRVIGKMLAPEPRRRFQNAAELIAALTATGLANLRLCLDGDATQIVTALPTRVGERRRPSVAVAATGIVTLALLVGAGYLAWTIGRPRGPLPPVLPAVAPHSAVDVAPVAPELAVQPAVEVEPADVVLARAISQITSLQTADARQTLTIGLEGHPGDASITRPLGELERGVLLLFQYQTPEEESPIVPLWLADGVTLTRRDNYRFAIILGRDCFVYAFQRDTRPNVTRIFPNPRYSPLSNPIARGQLHWLPEDPSRAGASWMHLDTSVGEERVYFVAVSRALRDPDGFGRQLVSGTDRLRQTLAQDPDALLVPGAPPDASCFAQNGTVMEVFRFNHK